MKIVFSFLLAAVIYAAPSRRSKCRPPIPRLRMIVKKDGDSVVDLTHEYNDTTLNWPSNPFGLEMTHIVKGLWGSGDETVYVESNWYRQPEHFGTHIDAPSHFIENGEMVSQIKLTGHLIGPGSLINLKHNNERLDGNYRITIDDILKWEGENGGRIRSGGIVLLYTGYGDFFHDQAAYFGTNVTGKDAVPHLRFPGLDPEAAKWLVTNRCIGGIGIDTLSIDTGDSKTFIAHQHLAAAGVPILENVGNLNLLASRVKTGQLFEIIALPQKMSKGTGAPTRIIAILD